MSRTKYVMSGGLAFAEDKDMEKLRRYSLKGWHVSDFKFMGYTLEKGESSDYIYSIDYHSLTEGDETEYYDLFSSSGWSHVASVADMHLFRALPGTKPIYSDPDTLVEKHKKPITSFKNFAIGLVLITALVWIGVIISAGTLNSFLSVVGVILTVIAVPTAWTLITTYSNKWAVEGKRRLVHLVKVIPSIVLLALFIPVLIADTMGTTVSILAYAVIGAIALPTAIWIIMSLYYKVVRK